MQQIKNPRKIQEAVGTVSISDKFSRDYSDLFLLFEYEKGEFIIKEGYENHYLFFVISGTVKCFSYATNGKSQFISYFSNPEAIGLVGSIWGKPAISTVQAADKCRLLALPLSGLRTELMNDVRFLRYLCLELCDTIQDNHHYLQLIQCTSIESKLASMILASQKNGICRLNLSFTAEFIGTTYRHVLRILNKFTSHDILEKSGKNYRIKDYAYLSACSEDSYDYVSKELQGRSGNLRQA